MTPTRKTIDKLLANAAANWGLPRTEHLALVALDPTTQHYVKPEPKEDNAAVGTLDYPLTERIASDILSHGEAWARSYHISRGMTEFEWNVFVKGSQAHIADLIERNPNIIDVMTFDNVAEEDQPWPEIATLAEFGAKGL